MQDFLAVQYYSILYQKNDTQFLYQQKNQESWGEKQQARKSSERSQGGRGS